MTAAHIRRLLLRTLVWCGRTVAAVAVLAVLLLLLLLLAPVRGLVLNGVIDQLDKRMPGNVTATGAAWPGFGRFELDRVLWTEGGDTLLAAGPVVVDLDVGALRRREILVRELRADVARADVPALQTALADSAAPDADAASPSLPAVPSFAVQALQLRADRVILSEEQGLVDARLAGRIELRRDRPRSVWIDSLACATRPATWSLESFDAGWAEESGLHPARIRGRLAPDRPLELDVAPRSAGGTTGFDWSLRVRGSEPVDPDSAGIDLAGTGSWQADPARLRIEAAGDVGGAAMRHAGLDLRLPDGASGPIDLDLRLIALGRDLSTQLRVVSGDSLVVELAPLEIAIDPGDGIPVRRPGSRNGRLVIPPGPRRFELAGLVVRADSVRARLDGVWQEDRGRLQLQASLPGPSALPDTLLPPGLDLAGLDRVEIRLEADVRLEEAGPAIEADLDLGGTGWIDSGRVRASASPRGVLLEQLDFRTPGLELEGVGRVDSVGAEFRLELALPGMAFTRRIEGLPAGLRLHRLRLDGTADWDSAGAIGPGTWSTGWSLVAEDTARGPLDLEGEARLRTASPDVALTVAGTAGEFELERADIRFGAAEGWRDPMSVELDAAAEGADLRGRANWTDGLLDVVLDVDWSRRPDRLLRIAGLDSLVWPGENPYPLSAAYRGDFDASTRRPGAGRLEVRAGLPGPAQLPAALLPEGVRVADLGPISVRLDAEVQPQAQGVAVDAGLDLSATDWIERGRVLARAAGGRLDIDELDLSVPGLEITGSGALDSTGSTATAEIVLPDDSLAARLPGLPTGLRVPRLSASARSGPRAAEMILSLPDGIQLAEHEWETAEIRLGTAAPAAAADSVSYRVRADGPLIGLLAEGTLRAGPAPSVKVDTLALRLQDRDLRSQRPFRLRAGAESGGWVVEDLDLGGSLGSVRADGRAGPDSLDATVSADLTLTADLLRALAPASPLPPDPQLRIHVSGRANVAGPVAEPAADLSVQAEVQGREQLDGLVLRADAATQRDEPGAAPLITGSLSLDRGAERLIDGSARIPATISLSPPVFAPSSVDSYRIDLSTRTLAMEDFAMLMPPGLSVGGTWEAKFRADGLGPEARLGGRFTAPQLRVELSDGSWTTFGGSVRFGGTTKRPVVDGSLRVDGGVIRIPEVPPALLPDEGEALLLDAPVTAASASSAAGPGAGGPSAATSEMELGLQLVCPGSLWLRGRGLSVELSGSLDITQQDLVPQVVGEMKAVQGSLKFLGRHFEVEEGTVTFYGDLEHDPYLDLKLTADIEGTRYGIAVRGRALAPELILSSDPEMAEGDIIASLLFGRPLDELDSGQESLLRQRTTQILATLGASRLTDSISDRIGADLVAFKQGESGGDASSLMVGKYLNPRVLVKYEQQLGSRSGFYVRLEYMLSRMFRLETSVGQGTESGVELKWGRDY